MELRCLLRIAIDDTQRVVLTLCEIGLCDRATLSIRQTQDPIARGVAVSTVGIWTKPNHGDIVGILGLDGVDAGLTCKEVAAMIDNEVVGLEGIGVAIDVHVHRFRVSIADRANLRCIASRIWRECLVLGWVEARVRRVGVVWHVRGASVDGILNTSIVA